MAARCWRLSRIALLAGAMLGAVAATPGFAEDGATTKSGDHASAAQENALPAEAPKQNVAERSAASAAPAAVPQFKHGAWPLCPPIKPAIPAVREQSWVKTPIDAFVLSKLEEKGLRPAPPADKRTLLRRVSFDLIGLPPTPAEQAAFVSDTSPAAYANLVDRLLASPQYGERWARHWLDVVHFAESDGFKQDADRPDAYAYRDYVIRAFNSDLPFDRFVQQQLAGDELEPENLDAQIATGYYRLHPDEYNAANLKQRRQEILNDITETTGLAFLGLTVGCAECHNHKFDAITQVDYYRFQAFFANLLPCHDQPNATPEQLSEAREKQIGWEEATQAIRDEMHVILYEHPFKPDAQKYDDETKQALLTEPERRTALDRQLVQLAERNIALEPKTPPADQKDRYERLSKQLAEFDYLKPAPFAHVLAVRDTGLAPPATHRLAGGNFKKPQEQVEPGFLSFLGDTEPRVVAPAGAPRSSGRRAALALWLTRPDQPMTGRVIVNRLWQHHFGVGIVGTPNDFGVVGDPPTHPELLDWLAVRLVESGWHLKTIQRLMVLSATYQQASIVDTSDPSQATAMAADPHNKLLWHMRRQRLEGEAIRDSVLCAAGDLNPRMFGPSARPELPAALDSNYKWKPDVNRADRNRRSIYVLAKRNLRFPLFDAFDWPDLHNSCARRSCTTTAPQALLLLNGEFTLHAARKFAERLRADHPSERKDLIRAAYQQAFGREPSALEVAAAAHFLSSQTELLKAAKLESKEPVGNGDLREFAATVDFCHALLNANEFVFVD
ncbi:MAG TPA: DUF1549 and DUF1553 domain-containing protein [Pirellulales bacterium]|jgi:hypothetical protein|nr:DUF1549 and DUF1553 domain-containing protein [Pirellulales bacterium]